MCTCVYVLPRQISLIIHLEHGSRGYDNSLLALQNKKKDWHSKTV